SGKGLRVVIPYAEIRELSFQALFTGTYTYTEGKKKQGRISRAGYFIDLALEFNEKVKEKLRGQHETLARFFKEAAENLGSSQFTVKLHKETSSAVDISDNFKYSNIGKNFGFRQTGFPFSTDNTQSLHNAIASMQFYLLALPGAFISVYCGDKLVAALNSEGFQTDSYMVVGLSKRTPEEGLIWRMHDTFTMRDYESFAKEYRANYINELGNILLRHNMGLLMRAKDFELQGKVLWFCWQKCVKPTLEEYFKSLKQKIELTLHDLESPIDFNTDDAYESEIIDLQKSPFIGTE
ncbi:MAG: hypothetical protein ACTSPW_09535, partial [Promethearchaeota archaeon]